MKQISIVLIIILLIAAVMFFLRDRGARAELQNAEKQIATLSNEVAKVNTLMMMHGVTNSELNAKIAKDLERLGGLSNRIAKTSEDLKRAQSEHQALQGKYEAESRKASDAARRVTELDGEVRRLGTAIEGRDSEIKRLTARLQEADTERAALQGRLEHAEAEVVRLQLDHMDPIALQAQLKRLKRQWPPTGYARLPKETTVAADKEAKESKVKVGLHAQGYYMQMQPDGTMRLVPPLEAAGAGGAK